MEKTNDSTVMQRCQTDCNLVSNCCQINNNPCWHFLIHWTFFIPLHEKEIIDYVKHHHKNQNTSPVPFPLQLAERAKEAARVKVVVPLTATVPRESPKLSSRSKTARVPPVGCGEPNVPSKRATSVLLLSLFRAKKQKKTKSVVNRTRPGGWTLNGSGPSWTKSTRPCWH